MRPYSYHHPKFTTQAALRRLRRLNLKTDRVCKGYYVTYGATRG